MDIVMAYDKVRKKRWILSQHVTKLGRNEYSCGMWSECRRKDMISEHEHLGQGKKHPEKMRRMNKKKLCRSVKPGIN